MEIQITESQLKSLLISEGKVLDDLIKKYVGKIISEDVFNEIKSVSHNKESLAAWLLKKVGDNIIDTTDIYKFDEYFSIFIKHQKKFPVADINQYKTKEDVNSFTSKAVEIREKNIEQGIDIDDSDKYVTSNEIDKLRSVGIEYLGINDGYQIFEIPNKLKGNEKAWKTYSNILGKCQGRDKGAKIDICTMANFSHFNSYLERYNDSSYFVMYNYSDPKSPYQFHFESGQYMDKNDNSVV